MLDLFEAMNKSDMWTVIQRSNQAKNIASLGHFMPPLNHFAPFSYAPTYRFTLDYISFWLKTKEDQS